MSTPLSNPSPSNSTPQISNAWYNRLKLAALLLLPLIGALYVGLDQIWGLPATDKVTATIVVVETFVGGAVKFFQVLYQAQSSNYDGTLKIVETEDGGSELHFGNISYEALSSKNEITLRLLEVPKG